MAGMLFPLSSPPAAKGGSRNYDGPRGRIGEPNKRGSTTHFQPERVTCADWRRFRLEERKQRRAAVAAARQLAPPSSQAVVSDGIWIFDSWRKSVASHAKVPARRGRGRRNAKGREASNTTGRTFSFRMRRPARKLTLPRRPVSSFPFKSNMRFHVQPCLQACLPATFFFPRVTSCAAEALQFVCEVRDEGEGDLLQCAHS